MSEENTEVNPLFVELIFQLQSAAWIHMGKIANPGTGKIERNLDLARGAIDMLGMIEEKTRGNLGGDEERLLRELLNQVRLNFVSEQEKAPAEAAKAEDATDEDASKEATTEKDAKKDDATEEPPVAESKEASPDEEASQKRSPESS